MSISTKPKILKGFKRAKPERRDMVKENVFRTLSDILTTGGYVVRREELKRGIGFQVSSGSCRHESSNLVFVDKRLNQDDQISFLTERIVGFGIKPAEDVVARLPQSIAKQIGC